MAETVADYLVKRLSAWGIKRIYGYPGDGINGIMGALQRSDHRIDFVQARHEEMASFMACGHAKFSGELGVCLATSGPGAIHMLNGLYDARKDNQPVFAIIGQTQRFAIGSDYQQEVDLSSLYKDVAGDFIYMATTPCQVRHLIDRGIRTAIAERTVTCLIMPKDLQDLEAVESPPREMGSTYSGIGYSFPRVIPKQDDLQRAADILNAGKRVAILVGAGAQDAKNEVLTVADILGAGIAKALLGKDVIPDDIPFVTGTMGLLGTRPSWAMMNECDTLLMIGSNFPYAEFLPKEGQARGIQIDIRPSVLSLRYPMEVNLQGDSRETLQALIPLLDRKEDRGWQERIETNMVDWNQLLVERAKTPANPVNPQRLFRELSEYLPNDAMITVDTGTATFWYSRDIQIRSGMQATLSGSLATMGCAVPYAIGAKFAFPHRPVIAIAGDGAMQMNGLAELITVSKYWQEWPDPRFVVLILNNQDLNFVSWEMRVLEGNPKFPASQDIPDLNYENVAQNLGFRGFRLQHPDNIISVVQEAFSSSRPAVINAYVDGDIPPLPPHISFEQAREMTMAMLKGDPDRIGIMKETAQEILRGILVPSPRSSMSEKRLI